MQIAGTHRLAAVALAIACAGGYVGSPALAKPPNAPQAGSWIDTAVSKRQCPSLHAREGDDR